MMTDDWLKDNFERAVLVASGEKEPYATTTLLRGFANRVLLEFGRDKTEEALRVPFTRDEQAL